MSSVSVIVPIYNAGNKLKKCIKSILDQTFTDFELILVNDGSRDNSLDICLKFGQKDKRIIIIDKHNEGSIPTRNKGVSVSKSEYIMFVDADDWIESTTIELLYNETLHCESDITVCNIYKVVGNGMLIKRKNNNKYFIGDRIYNKEEIRNELVAAFIHAHPFPTSLYAKLYKKELLLKSGKYLKDISFMGDDLFYNIEVFLKANKVKVIDKYLYYYRAGGNTSKYMPFLFADTVKAYEIQKEVIGEYYQDSLKKRYDVISVGALNTFKTVLSNIFSSNLKEDKMKELIMSYVCNDYFNEWISTDYAKEYFPVEYLNAIQSKDAEYLFRLGQGMYKKNIPKKYLLSIISKIS
ncbi:glycosyltransferase family 2 protein [Paenibacillus periandrae]|uniref:glycosyltransferase family 2 protein n=1 Tax=Paenibacillus periandrae TaxID=1761741 RepID=UPI001F098A40|nr:glycosyltransferase family 2 protein [Paenibacillus periandrae]